MGQSFYEFRQKKVQPVHDAKKTDREAVIDENLKRVFNETLDEGIPDRFKDLLSQLKQQDDNQSNAK